MASVSLPAPPLKLSPGFSVDPLATKPLVPTTVLTVSLPVTLVVPAEPMSEELSAAVVSVRYVRCKSLILNSVIIFTSINDEITT